MKIILTCLLLLLTNLCFAKDNVLNIYLWAGEVPDDVIAQFEKETHIKVNYSTYDSNETLYAKFKAIANPGYDIIEPSGYYIPRMVRDGMLQKIDKSKIPNWKYLNPSILHPDFDPEREYTVPALWGVTGIFVNKRFYDPEKIKSWQDLWSAQYKDKLLLLNDVREVFSISLLALNLSANSQNPREILQAYQHLLSLEPNIKLYATDAVPAIIADDDAVIGSAWNGDVFAASHDNPDIVFIYPTDGFVAWADNFSIPKGAKHLENAYLFLNFVQRPDVNAKIIKEQGYSTGNDGAKAYLPKDMQNSTVIFPPDDVMERATWQSDISDQALMVYEKYWELLKLS